MSEETDRDSRRHAPLQFGIRTILAATAALAVLLGGLRWIDAAPKPLLIVAAVVAVAAVAAAAFAVSLGRMGDRRHDSPSRRHDE